MCGATAGNAVADLTWDEVARRIAAGAAAILPVGAAAKQHGLHLPMNTDLVQAEWLANQLALRIDALYWPVLSYGHYPAFVQYSGSISLSAPLFQALVTEVVESLLQFDVPFVFVLDTGISTIPVIGRAVSAFGPAGRVHHLRIHDGPRYRQVHGEILDRGWGGHADEAETSRMLALMPACVNLARAVASGPADRMTRGPLVHADPHSPNFSGSGSIGDPTGATSAKGERLLAAMLDDLTETAQMTLRP
ncbi:MAG: creatininase family protein [Pseudorhodoplanes sp.]|uniref:creatininase family protein n=1 Tax=Pseudorhodoplanes sp. TaxID=1934341 RepID=UPI003D0C1236